MEIRRRLRKTRPVTFLDLLVLRCADLQRTRAFYETAGISFIEEQHGTGPEHLSGVVGDTVLELYPATAQRSPEVGLRIGLSVADPLAVHEAWLADGHQLRTGDSERSFLDPDGRIVALSLQADPP